MNRLTERLENGVVRRTGLKYDSVMLRLAAYEDTGLMPEEVEELKQAYVRYGDALRDNSRLRSELARVTAGRDETELADDTGNACKYCKKRPCTIAGHSLSCGGFKWRGLEDGKC